MSIRNLLLFCQGHPTVPVRRVFVAALLLLSAGPGFPTSVVLFDDAVLADRSELIVVGRVVSVDPFAGIDRPLTIYGVRIDRSLGRLQPAGSYVAVEVGVGVLPGGLELRLDGAPRFEAGEEELFAHELGHTLGLGHSTVPGALMRASAYGDGRGAAIALDDRYGICSLYCLSEESPDQLFVDGFESGDTTSWSEPPR